MKLRRRLPGLSYTPKLRIEIRLTKVLKQECEDIFVKCISVVEEHSVVGRSSTERSCGRSRRENAGISSESKVRILAVENLRIPGEGSSAQGKSGPKARPEGVVDGHQVKIPELFVHVKKQ